MFMLKRIVLLDTIIFCRYPHIMTVKLCTHKGRENRNPLSYSNI